MKPNPASPLRRLMETFPHAGRVVWIGVRPKKREAPVAVAEVEAIAGRDPAQYQWTYKRYTLRPSGRGEDNPYRAIERRRR